MSLQDKKRLRETTPDNEVASLQEQLIAAKLREAEATVKKKPRATLRRKIKNKRRSCLSLQLALKELRPKITELSSQWQKYMNEHHPPAASASLASEGAGADASADAAAAADAEAPAQQQQQQQQSTPKKLLGQLWDSATASAGVGRGAGRGGSGGAGGAGVEEELMTTRLREMEAVNEVRELRLRVMELETHVSLSFRPPASSSRNPT